MVLFAITPWEATSASASQVTMARNVRQTLMTANQVRKTIAPSQVPNLSMTLNATSK